MQMHIMDGIQAWYYWHGMEEDPGGGGVHTIITMEHQSIFMIDM